MKKLVTALFDFFASVQLAIFLLCFLAITSIIGTVIPQNESLPFYQHTFGESGTRFIFFFSLEDMYSSVWFVTALCLLAINLIVCSWYRFPKVWRIIRQDNLMLPLERIKKMKRYETVQLDPSSENAVELVQTAFTEKRLSYQLRSEDSHTLLFTQKTPWSRAGVYIVHLSIIIIFIGALYDSLCGYKGFLLLPEGQKSDIVYPEKGDIPIELGFFIGCEEFDIEYYSNAMPKEYRSRLIVEEEGQTSITRDIEVNKPLRHKGIAFYQSSYKPLDDFIFILTTLDKTQHYFNEQSRELVTWPEKKLQFGILREEKKGQQVTKVKIWFRYDTKPAETFWLQNGEERTIETGSQTYLFSMKQRYATGLQVVKAPGVWTVYTGFGLLLLGLYITFFLSHKRIWAYIHHEEKPRVDIFGDANKNKAGLERDIQELTEILQRKKAL